MLTVLIRDRALQKSQVTVSFVFPDQQALGSPFIAISLAMDHEVSVVGLWRMVPTWVFR